jgi:hypothetical protein
MSETFEHNPNDHEDPLAGPTWTIGIIGVILLAVSLLGLTALFYDRTDVELDVKVLEVPSAALDEMRATQNARLAGVRLEKRVAEEESIVIPIERAMEIIVQENAPENPGAGGGD